MTDIELTEKAAKWLGLKWVGPYIGRTETELLIDGIYTFDPLHDMNDLWKVIEKLPINKIKILLLIEDPPRYEIVNNCGFGKMSVIRDLFIKEGKLSDLPRAVLELVAEMEVKG